jgi:hypothetical protein
VFKTVNKITKSLNCSIKKEYKRNNSNRPTLFFSASYSKQTFLA